MSSTVSEIASLVERWAPPKTAQSYDNVGLQVGRPEKTVKRCLIALDLVPAVVKEAIEVNADLVLTHHPAIFRPLKSVSSSNLVGSMILDLAESGIAYYAAHTNLDAAHGGVSFALANQLGLQNIEFLTPLDHTRLWVRSDVLPAIPETLLSTCFELGAGKCRISETTNESAGTTSKLSTIEMEVDPIEFGFFKSALADRYPDLTFDWRSWSLGETGNRFGMGAIGDLDEACTLDEFLSTLCQILETETVRYSAPTDNPVKRVAVCGGSGSSLLSAARNKHADVLVTADVTYHTYFDTLNTKGEPDMGLVDVGHAESERIAELLLRDWLLARIPSVDWLTTSVNTSPMKHFISKM